MFRYGTSTVERGIKRKKCLQPYFGYLDIKQQHLRDVTENEAHRHKENMFGFT